MELLSQSVCQSVSQLAMILLAPSGTRFFTSRPVLLSRKQKLLKNVDVNVDL